MVIYDHGSIPLHSLQSSWLHVCVAVSCADRSISVVVNGFRFEETPFPESSTRCPTSLSRNLLLQKGYVSGAIWSQSWGKVTNLNIFYGLMSMEGMVERTSGRDCGKQDGDYMIWANSSWVLEGAAQWTDVSVEDLCRKVSSIQLFTTEGVSNQQDCKHLCSKLQERGHMAPAETPEQFKKVKDRMGWFVNLSSRLTTLVLWLPMRIKKNILVDIYTGDEISKPLWRPGYPINDSKKSCAVYGSGGDEGFVNWQCNIRSGFYCGCHFPERPILSLRGLCKESHIDQIYSPQNSPLDGELVYYGNIKTYARFLREDKLWKLGVFVYNTAALSKEAGKRFMLGKQNWTISGDSKACHDGQNYTAELKLTGCNQEGEFTCDDGQCIAIEKRCDQVTGKEPNCRDESDENGCQLIVFKNNYNKNIPPIKSGKNGSAIPANVSISITLMKVVEIEETDLSIHLQFQISLQWQENRVKYQNLKKDTALNALTNEDIKKLWLPLILYDNTDQKVVTRLGEYGNGEWMTMVTVTRDQRSFTRSEVDEVDEAEIFEGSQNRLTMNQTYTWEFQCQYELQRYPFDTQVKKKRIMIDD